MARNISIVYQKMLVPHGRVNGVQLYKDYGLQKIWIYDQDNDPPTVMKAGLAFSGDYELDPAYPIDTSKGAEYGVGEIMPEIKHIPHWDSNKEGSGIIPAGAISI